MQHRESTAVQQPTVVTPSQNLVESLGNAQGRFLPQKTDGPFARADALKKKPVSICSLQSSSSLSFDIHGFKVFAPVDFLIKEGERDYIGKMDEQIRSQENENIVLGKASLSSRGFLTVVNPPVNRKPQ
ncbi:hypothetical protein AVEN_169843-1 [Araneus ventricosus]|uniref:Uncharacterized protein n=1 Tax=Araneus ventricosus TaxID=182803 RepID=A0A4Y2HEB8_ARAVE|nr:hypothetical protein AVEN_169843-1 [Araneus ventricosus]